MLQNKYCEDFVFYYWYENFVILCENLKLLYNIILYKVNNFQFFVEIIFEILIFFFQLSWIE